jgi:nitrite reductase/ring-hydroxylating ferredoxin subunit
MANFVRVASAGEIAPGTARQVAVGGKTLAIYNVNGTFYCTDGICLHRGGPLGEGDLDGNTITCPWHGWEYDVTTGVGKTNPAARLACFAVKVEGGEVQVSVD